MKGLHENSVRQAFAYGLARYKTEQRGECFEEAKRKFKGILEFRKRRQGMVGADWTEKDDHFFDILFEVVVKGSEPNKVFDLLNDPTSLLYRPEVDEDYEQYVKNVIGLL